MAATVFLSGWIDFQALRFYPTNLSFNEQADMIDVTDLSTGLELSDFVWNKAKANFTAEGWLEIDQAFPTRGDEITLDLDFEGFAIAGAGRIQTVNVDAVFDTAIRITLSGVFVGQYAITEV